MNKKHLYNILLNFLIFFMYFVNSGSLIYQKNYEKIYTIEHLCFNTLMAFPDKALNSNNTMSNLFDKTKITIHEFNNILNELYSNDFMLINIDDIYSYENNILTLKNLQLPPNKKPLILSFDNVTYISNYQNMGEIDKVIIDRNNNLATYTTKKSIQDRIQSDNEFMVILENFISEHQDFSFNNARGIIFFSGENGILGYNTNHKNTQRNYESKRAKEVIFKLKSLGWKFGSNNYKYTDDNYKSEIEFTKELDLWNQEILPLTDKTNLYSFPHGAILNSADKLNTLNSYSFNFFFYNNFTPSLYIDSNNIFMSRKFICGDTLRNNYQEFQNLFDSKKVYDYEYRKILFS